MDMKGLAAGLCGLGKELEGETSSAKAFGRIMEFINTQSTDDDTFVQVASLIMKQYTEHQIEQNGDHADEFDTFEQTGDNVQWNFLTTLLDGMYDDTDDMELYRRLTFDAQFSDDDILAAMAENFHETEWPDDEPEKEEDGGGGTVHVSAHTRGDVKVTAYDRDPPAKTGGDSDNGPPPGSLAGKSDVEITDGPRYFIWPDGNKFAVWDMVTEQKVGMFKNEEDAGAEVARRE